MSAIDILDDVRARGLTLEVSGDNLIARPRAALTDETRALLRAHKAVLIAALKSPVRTAFWRWQVTLSDGHRLQVYFTPEATQQEVERQYPGAEVEPLPDDRKKRVATEAEAAELCRIVAVIYAQDSGQDRAEALALALADADAALCCYRSLVERLK